MSARPVDRHVEIARRVPWAVLGDVPDAERRQVDRHLESCAACRDLAEAASELASVLPALSDADLDHPEAPILAGYALFPDALDPEIRGSVATHLEGCAPCREAVVLCRAAERSGSPEDDADERPATGGTTTGTGGGRKRRRGGILRLVLHPALAAVYLVAAVGLGIALLGEPGLPGTAIVPTGGDAFVLPPAVRVVPDDTFRGGEAPGAETDLLVPLPDGPAVGFDLVTELDPLDWPEDGSIVLRFAGTPQPTVRSLDPDDIDEYGRVGVLVPAAGLESGVPYTLTIERRTPGGTATLFSATVRFRDTAG